MIESEIFFFCNFFLRVCISEKNQNNGFNTKKSNYWHWIEMINDDSSNGFHELFKLVLFEEFTKLRTFVKYRMIELFPRKKKGYN